MSSADVPAERPLPRVAAALGATSARRFWLGFHKWSGLAIAFFVSVAGLTGAVIAYHNEIERVLNPRLFVVEPGETALTPMELRTLAERHEPRGMVTFVELDRRPDESASFFLVPRIDPRNGRPFELEHDQLFLEPYTGELLGKRLWGKVDLDREHLVALAYRLHFDLALPSLFGEKILGVAALIWLINCLVGLYLTFPARGPLIRGWKRSWRLRWPSPLSRLALDFHRSMGLWTWVALIVFALSAVQFNLRTEVFEPVLRSAVEFRSLDDLVESDDSLPDSEPRLDWGAALERGRELISSRAVLQQFTPGQERQLTLLSESAAYIYSVDSSLDVGRGAGTTEVIFNAVDGRELGLMHPRMAAGNTISSWLTALHAAQIGGRPYQLFVALFGIAIVFFAVAGVIVWLKRRGVWLKRPEVTT